MNGLTPPPSASSRLTVSLVVYKSQPEELEALLRSISGESVVASWVVVDNFGTPGVRVLTEMLGGRYVASGANIGFGAGHNLAWKALAHVPSDFHLLVNPDIAFAPGTLDRLTAMMAERPEVALAMPKVLYPDGSIQLLCKLLPRPADLVLRRFAPGFLKKLAQRRIARYEYRNADPGREAEVPFLSGCFMFLRRRAFEAAGGFDEGYFLYMEDVDLCRRMASHGKLLYWPGVEVTHVHMRESHSNWRLTWVFVRSALRYFNKWGWVWDRTSRQANRAALAQLRLAARREK